MEEEKLGCFGNTWNLVAVIVFVVSICFSYHAFTASEGNDVSRLGAFFVSLVSGVYTLYQVYKRKPKEFLSVIKHEFVITRKSISGSAIWIVNRIQGHITEEHEKTRSFISNNRSVNYGLDLLRKSNWSYIPCQYRFFCDDDTDWCIVQEEQTRETFHEPWMDNLLRPNQQTVVYRTVLKRNDTEIKEVIFLDMDGSRITMPLPQKQGASAFYYCENSFEHLMFNIVRHSMGIVMDGVELSDLADQAHIEWRRC